MTIPDYISRQLPDRQKMIAEIHEIILAKDKTVQAEIEPMMGKEMIIYKASGMFKYGLSSVKDHMSLHVLPIYCSPELHAKYKKLLPLATFQKGCINFRNSESVPTAILRDLIGECSRIDLFAIRQNQLQSKAKNRKTG